MIEYLLGSLSLGSIVSILFYLFIIFAIIGFIKGSLRKMNNVISSWHEHLEYQPFSPRDFYSTLEQEIRAKAIPNLYLSRILYPQGGMFSVSREYLRVQCREYVFDICAAPFAKGFFVSYWMGETSYAMKDLLKNMPWIGKFFKQRQKTFFELDNEMLFKEVVGTTVKKVFHQLIETKGIRALADTEQLSINTTS